MYDYTAKAIIPANETQLGYSKEEADTNTLKSTHYSLGNPEQ